jgi:hypothetical protein
MTEKLYIRVKKDGFIYDFNEQLAKNPTCEVITEKEAFPERFITPEIEAKIAEIVETTKPKRGRKPRKPLNVGTDIHGEPVYTDPELAAEAARGLPE